MAINASGSAILYLQSEIHSPQKKCLSVINLDTTIRVEFKFISQEYFARMCIRICYERNSCDMYI